MNAHWFYYLVKITGWIGLKIFFGGIKIIGLDKVPKDGAILLAPNHQGAFMDAVVSGVYFKKPVSFLTRADVFNKWSDPILKSLNMMPIYRIRDGIQSLSQNDAVFDTCFRMLSEEKAILIFPEGNHSKEHYLRPISKGTSRLALDARDQINPSTKIYIIPTGINYFSHSRPLAKIFLVYGDAIELEDYMKLYREHKQKGYNKLKEDLTQAMKDTLILPEKDEHYEKKQAWIFQPKHESLSFEELKAMGRSDQYEEVKPRNRNFLSRIFIVFFTLFNLLPLLGVRKLLQVVKDPVFKVSLKYIGGGIFHLLWWIIFYLVGAIWIGWEAGLLFVATAVLSMFARQSLIKY
ncbi:1-acyl-sn-glycerol-3-phosphate acyltransferase [Marinoscillum sp.]|uniref:1-acyl-sn-glycerol-3-phosphate acyltransferase n=1 Tax=Marinoscillum sp. TaxID=2024838 RepID=UPI003BAC8BA7